MLLAAKKGLPKYTYPRYVLSPRYVRYVPSPTIKDFHANTLSITQQHRYNERILHNHQHQLQPMLSEFCL